MNAKSVRAIRRCPIALIGHCIYWDCNQHQSDIASCKYQVVHMSPSVCVVIILRGIICKLTRDKKQDECAGIKSFDLPVSLSCQSGNRETRQSVRNFSHEPLCPLPFCRQIACQKTQTSRFFVHKTNQIKYIMLVPSAKATANLGAI